MTSLYTKLVERKRDGRLISHLACALPKGCIQEYRLNEWTEAPLKGSGLFVYDSAQYKKVYYNSVWWKTVEVYLCEAEGEIEMPSSRVPFADSAMTTMRRYWERQRLLGRDTRPAPLATRVFERVRLIHKVEHDLDLSIHERVLRAMHELNAPNLSGHAY